MKWAQTGTPVSLFLLLGMGWLMIHPCVCCLPASQQGGGMAWEYSTKVASLSALQRLFRHSQCQLYSCVHLYKSIY